MLMLQYKLDSGEQHLLNEAFKPDNDLFGPINLHLQSDWIISHPEAPQDFKEFFSDPYRKIPSPEKYSICTHILLQLDSKILELVPVSIRRCSFRKKPGDAFCIVGITINHFFDTYYTPEVTSIGHIFGLQHCQWLACLMQDSNHLEETDWHSFNLCPICLHKLPFSTKHSHEDNVNLPKPVETFKEWK
ncbi:unnamed protein product [Nyctereutes procyonoides]|uniref:Archaemetzincin-2 n=1 Tax=Nyctereutes procyonoides TaxID=34880 RepID=A0A811YNT8_NYCPR|nr:unnamed protein product [Nyctereutes procyonoides]